MELDTSTREIIRSSAPPIQTTPHLPVTSVTNRTDYSVEELSVIVWCVGGVLLISLFALLGRIILARRKDPLTTMSRHQRHSIFSIRIDTQTSRDTYPPSRDTLDLVHGAEVPVIDNTPPHGGPGNRGPEHTEQHHQQQQRLSEPHSPTATANNSASTQQTRDTNGGNYPTTRAAGSLVSLNGLVIQPPPYSAVVSSDVRLPSVVVGRNQRYPPPRRILLSL